MEREDTRKEAGQIVDVIKEIMRERKLRYHQLAEYLEIAESTVKRFMNDAELPLSRLLSICRWLDISLDALYERVRELRYPMVRFTEAQEEFFSSNLGHLNFFLALLGGKTPNDVSKEHKMGGETVSLYLRDLEKEGLLERLDGENVRLLLKGDTVVWDHDGPIGKTYTENYINTISQRAVAKLTNRGDLRLWTGSKTLTVKQYKNMQQDIEEVVERYRILSAGQSRKTGADFIQFLFITDVWEDPSFSIISDMQV
ncbi:MAG: helix-turn-helix domain-containing protein [Oligoflexales bacterium]